MTKAFVAVHGREMKETIEMLADMGGHELIEIPEEFRFSRIQKSYQPLGMELTK